MGFNSGFKGLNFEAMIYQDDFIRQTDVRSMENFSSYITKNTKHTNYQANSANVCSEK